MHSPDNGLLPRHFQGGLLRRLEPDDLAAFQAYRSIPELGQYQGWSTMADTEALAFLTRMSMAPMFCPGEWLQLGIAEPAGGRLIGDIGLFLAVDECAAEIGFTLEPDSQGRGIATAAVREAVHLLFVCTNVRQVRGITDARNTASVRLLERVGFRFEESRETVFRGEACTERIYALLRKDN